MDPTVVYQETQRLVSENWKKKVFFDGLNFILRIPLKLSDELGDLK